MGVFGSRGLARGRIVAVIVAGGLLAGGCAGESQPVAAASSELRIAWVGPPTTLDPAREPSLVTRPYQMAVYDRLVEVLPDATLGPMLATSWEFSADGLALTMQLREDVTFHDGTAFDAAAVVANIERSKTLEESTVKERLSKVTAVKAVNDHEVRFELSQPMVNLPAELGTSIGMMISPRALNRADLDSNPAGSGPYKVTEFEAGERVVYEPATDYWDDRVDPVDRLELSFVAENSARMNALRTGAVDVINLRPSMLADAEALQRDGSHKIYEFSTATYYGMFFDYSKAPFDDERVRAAISMAVNRKDISENLLDGTCTPTAQIFTDAQQPYDAELESITPFDPDRSKQLLAEAGHGDGLVLESVSLTLSPQREVAEVLQEQFADVGITLKLKPMDGSEAVSSFWLEGNQRALIAHTTASADFGYTVAQFVSRNPAGPPDGVAELAQKAANPTASDSERAALYTQIAKIVAEGHYQVPICSPMQLWLATSNVQNVDDMPWTFSNVYDPRYLTVS